MGMDSRQKGMEKMDILVSEKHSTTAKKQCQRVRFGTIPGQKKGVKEGGKQKDQKGGKR